MQRDAACWYTPSLDFLLKPPFLGRLLPCPRPGREKTKNIERSTKFGLQKVKKQSERWITKGKRRQRWEIWQNIETWKSHTKCVCVFFFFWVIFALYKNGRRLKFWLFFGPTDWGYGQKGLRLPLGRRVCETKIQKWALQTQKTLNFKGFLRSEGDWDHGLRPWSRKGPDIRRLWIMWATFVPFFQEQEEHLIAAWNGTSLGSQHPSPDVKTLCNFEPQIWPEIITSSEMPKVLVLKAQGRHVQK